MLGERPSINDLELAAARWIATVAYKGGLKSGELKG
jgi:hypothetical protein